MAISVVLAVDSIADALVDKISERIPAIKVGPASEPDNEMGPLITGEHRDKVARYIAGAPGDGATVVVDGRDGAPTDGFFLKPSLLDHVKPGTAAYDNEIFGPVLGVTRISGYAEGLALINDNQFGNGTAIFTRDGGAARQFEFDVQVGMVGVNVPIPVPVSYYSFGGWKASLFGDTHMYGPDGVRFFTKTKVVTSRWPDPATSLHQPRLPGEPCEVRGRPPDARRRRGAVIELAKRAETYGFEYVWTFDSHILWEEPYVIYSQILAETRNLTVGPMVTNPATRDWTVTASLYATLNEMYGNRTICGIGRGDSAVRVTNGAPTTLATLRDSVHVIRELANGRSVDYKGSELRLPWAQRSELEIWVAAYGPKALQLTGEVGDGFILQLADLSIAEWTIGAVRKAAADAGRDPDDVTICVAAPAYVTDGTAEGLAHGREQCRWFGGMVGNHVADIVARYGDGHVDGPAGADRLHQGSRRLRLQRARPGRQHPHPVRARRDRRSLLHRRAAGGARRADGGAEGARCRPVRRLPPARRQGPHPRRLRRDGRAGRRRGGPGEVVSERSEPS